jgi:hypothetical protein
MEAVSYRFVMVWLAGFQKLRAFLGLYSILNDFIDKF